jgi:hypothetical protein
VPRTHRLHSIGFFSPLFPFQENTGILRLTLSSSWNSPFCCYCIVAIKAVTFLFTLQLDNKLHRSKAIHLCSPTVLPQ